MNITKKNGKVVLYDTEKIVKSILKADVDTLEEEVSRHMASYIADDVFAKLTREKEIITTQDVRDAVYAKLREMGLPHTAEQYIHYAKKTSQ